MLTVPAGHAQAVEQSSNPSAAMAEGRKLRMDHKHSKQQSVPSTGAQTGSTSATGPGLSAPAPDTNAPAHVPIPRLSLAIPESAASEQQGGRSSVSAATGQTVLDTRRQQGLAAQSVPVLPRGNRPPPPVVPPSRHHGAPASSSKAPAQATVAVGAQPMAAQVRWQKHTELSKNHASVRS
jgi:hypothetical protein